MSGAEQDKLDHPPRRHNESAKDFLIRTLVGHRQCHINWVGYLQEYPEARQDATGDVSYQESCVARYNSLIAALEEL